MYLEASRKVVGKASRKLWENNIRTILLPIKFSQYWDIVSVYETLCSTFMTESAKQLYRSLDELQFIPNRPSAWYKGKFCNSI